MASDVTYGTAREEHIPTEYREIEFFVASIGYSGFTVQGATAKGTGNEASYTDSDGETEAVTINDLGQTLDLECEVLAVEGSPTDPSTGGYRLYVPKGTLVEVRTVAQTRTQGTTYRLTDSTTSSTTDAEGAVKLSLSLIREDNMGSTYDTAFAALP